MLYKLEGNLKDGVSFNFNKFKQVKGGEIGLVDLYISNKIVVPHFCLKFGGIVHNKQTYKDLDEFKSKLMDKITSTEFFKINIEKVSKKVLIVRYSKTFKIYIEYVKQYKSFSDLFNSGLTNNVDELHEERIFYPKDNTFHDDEIISDFKEILTIVINSSFNIDNLEFKILNNPSGTLRTNNSFDVQYRYSRPKIHIPLDDIKNKFISTLSKTYFAEGLDVQGTKPEGYPKDYIENDILTIKNFFFKYFLSEKDDIIDFFTFKIINKIYKKVTLIYDKNNEEIIKEMLLKASFIQDTKEEKPGEITFQTDEEQIIEKLNIILKDKLKIKVINDNPSDIVLQTNNPLGLVLGTNKVKIKSPLKSLNSSVEGINIQSVLPEKIIDLCVYFKFIKGPIFRIVADKLPVYIKPSNVMYFPFKDVELFDKLELSFDKNELDFITNVVVDFNIY